jgi:tetratricopeptide (TPR) repeat protein
VNRATLALTLCTLFRPGGISAQIPTPDGQAASAEERVKALYNAKHFSEAAEIAKSSPSASASLLYYGGLALARTDQLRAAGEMFRRASKGYPKDKRFPLELAGIAYREKHTASAKRLLHRGLSLDPHDEYGNDFLGTLYSLEGNLAGALFYWNRIGKPVLQNVQFRPVLPLNPVLRERTFALSGGQRFTGERLRFAESNLDRLDVFADVQYDLVPRKQDDRYDLLIRTVPVAPPLAGWLGRSLPSLRQLPYQGLAYDANNLNGNGVNLNVLGRWDPDKRRVSAELTGPWHENPRTEYRFFLDLRDERWSLNEKYFSFAGGLNGLALRKAQAGGDFEFGLSSKLQWTVGGLIAFREYGHTPRDPLFARGWSAEMNNRLDYLLWSWADHRLRVNSFASLRTGRLFSQTPSRLITARAGTSAVWFPQAQGDRYILTEKLGAGRTFGTVPLDELFILGMERDNDRDVWLRGTVGTREGRKGNAPVGTQYAISQTDFSRKLFELPFVRGYLGPFFDVGAVGDPSRRYGSRGVLYDTGIQGAIKTVGAVKVTLVYGRDIVNGRGVFYTAVSR